MSDVELLAVEKRFDDTVAVEGVTLRAEEGSFLVLLGPSGCGKSTTLRLVAGLEDLTSGRILIDGREVGHLPPSRRGVSMVFQNYALFPHLNVAENIVFGLKARGAPRAEREQRLSRAADILGLDQLLHRKPAQLSGGQRQRVALGRAIVAEAPVCLMDEPLSNLDAKLRHEMRTEIRELQRRLGITMVYVTHDQSEAMSMADQVVLMHEGRIEQRGTPRDLYERPATERVARFIGTPPMNILDVTSELTDFPLERLNGQPADGVRLGFRPEAAEPADDGIACRVEIVEYLGADLTLDCSLGQSRFVVRTKGAHHISPGDTIRLRLSAEDCHLFAASDGRRIGA
jgi:sn-glycerol 3-phosphate transport system ATP-binding protein